MEKNRRATGSVSRKRVGAFVCFSLRCLCSPIVTAMGLERVETIPEVVPMPTIAATRSQRFPSAEERLKIYMSNWYAPSCPGYTEGLVRYAYDKPSTEKRWTSLILREMEDQANATTWQFESIIAPDTAFFLDRATLMDCLRGETEGSPEFADRIEFRHNMHMYCSDVADSVMTAIDHVSLEAGKQSTVPTLLQFGDLPHSHVFRFLNIPVFKKFRSGATRLAVADSVAPTCVDGPRVALETLQKTTYRQPIVWKLATNRHYRLIHKVYREDMPWAGKRNMAVFRGQLTGSLTYNKRVSDEENCMSMRRCRLVYTHANSTLVNARLTSTRNRLPNVLNGVSLVEESVPLRRLLSFKAIIMLEGNDVASGLKWALLSQSVVLMPPPKVTSWALEELLEPWVHYIPLSPDASDVEEKMAWVIDNDDIAQTISERGTLWMEDLCFHPDANDDDRWIQEEMVRRYRSHFVEARKPLELTA